MNVYGFAKWNHYLNEIFGTFLYFSQDGLATSSVAILWFIHAGILPLQPLATGAPDMLDIPRRQRQSSALAGS